MGTFGINRIYSVGRMVKVADRMRWGFAPAWVRSPPYLKSKLHHNFSREASLRGSVCGCMCVYTHTHAYTVQMEHSDVSPGVGMRHLEGPKNQDGLNLGIHIFVYVYKVHMCMHMLGVGIRSWTNCFFLLHIFPSEKEKQNV